MMNHYLHSEFNILSHPTRSHLYLLVATTTGLFARSGVRIIDFHSYFQFNNTLVASQLVLPDNWRYHQKIFTTFKTCSA